MSAVVSATACMRTHVHSKPSHLPALTNAHPMLIRYPKLTFPEIYMLKGGYKSFFAEHPDKCSPASYRIMLDVEFKNECASAERRAKQSKKLVQDATSGIVERATEALAQISLEL